MLTELLGGFVTAISGGGLFGILGSIATTFLKQRAEQKEHEREMDRQRMAIQVADKKGSWDGLQASHESAALIAANSHQWSNDIKNIFRPFITTLLVALTFWMFLEMLSILTGVKAIGDSVLTHVFDYNEVILLVKYYVNSMVFATSASIMWWFGDRAQMPPGLRNI